MAMQPRELNIELIRLRHELHQEPEVGLTLPRTEEKVLRALPTGSARCQATSC